jgi:hypothetical protein
MGDVILSPYRVPDTVAESAAPCEEDAPCGEEMEEGRIRGEEKNLTRVGGGGA